MPKEPYSDFWTGFGMVLWFWGQILPLGIFLAISHWLKLSENQTTAAVLLCGFGWMTIYRNTLGLYILQRLERYRAYRADLPSEHR